MEVKFVHVANIDFQDDCFPLTEPMLKYDDVGMTCAIPDEAFP